MQQQPEALAADPDAAAPQAVEAEGAPVVHFDLPPGTPLQLGLMDIPDRLASRLVGYEVGRYVAVKLPALPRDVKVPNLFAPGTPVVTRYVHAGAAFGFRSEILGALYSPVRLLLLGFPRTLEDFKIREHRRIACLLPGDLSVDGRVLRGHVVDISRAGCRFELAGGQEGADLEVGAPVEIALLLPGLSTAVSMPGELRAVQTLAEGMALGLLFQASAEHIDTHLASFLDEAGG